VPGVEVIWVGAEELVAKLERTAVEAPLELGKALYVEAQRIMLQSLRLCPIDTGNLRSTGHVQPPEITGRMVTVLLGYNTPYAIFVHENLNARHKPPTQAKYLEMPVLEASRGLATRLGLEMKL
jgi:hypothetical protein